MFDYLQGLSMWENSERKLSISLSNVSGHKETYQFNITGLPEKWKVSGLPVDTFGIENNGRKTYDLSGLADTISDYIIKCSLILTRSSASDNIRSLYLRRIFK